MSIRVEFEAANAKLLWQQIVEYIEAAGATSQPATVNVRAEASKAKAEVARQEAPAEEQSSPPAPTPAIVEALRANDIPESEWENVGRTGKGDRMTKADVLKYAKVRTVELLNDDPLVPVLEEALYTPADVTPETAGISPEDTEETTTEEDSPLDFEFFNTQAPEEVTQEVALTREDVNTALKLAYDSPNGGRVKCLDILERFGIKATRDLKEDQYSEFVTQAEGIAAGTYDPSLAG